MLKDYCTAPISDAEKALFKFIEKVNKHSTQVRLDELDEPWRAGWSDEALYYANYHLYVGRFLQSLG